LPKDNLPDPDDPIEDFTVIDDKILGVTQFNDCMSDKILESQILTLPRRTGSILDVVSQELRLSHVDSPVIRWGILADDGQQVTVEIAVLGRAYARAPLTQLPGHRPPGDIHVAIVIPTGVGAAIGGFIGDAGPVVKAFGAISDSVIVHPNVVNGSALYGGSKQSLYVDGFTLDAFLNGAVRIGRAQRPKVGIILDRVAEQDETDVRNAINACRCVHGVDVVAIRVLDEKLEATVHTSSCEHYYGSVSNPDVLFSATAELAASGATCLAVVTDLNETTPESWQAHYRGIGVNPVGATEALISRAITAVSGLPCAHAPLRSCIQHQSGLVDPRAAAEAASGTTLPCILLGFQQLGAAFAEGLHVSELTAVIVPSGCVGGAVASAATKFGVPLLCIDENTCKIGLHADQLDNCRSAVRLATYLDAIGWLVCAKAGIALQMLRRPVNVL